VHRHRVPDAIALIPERRIRSQGHVRPWLRRFRLPLSRRVFVAVLASTSAVVGAPQVAAHEGGELGIEIRVERVAPGDVLPVIGADWAPGAVLEIRLLGANGQETPLGTIRVGADGHFAASLRVPGSVTAGPAAVQARSDYGVLDTTLVVIDPAAPAASSPVGATAGEGAGASAGTDVVPFAALGLAVVALAVLVRKTRAAPRSPSSR
jgi:hypothetical protein